MSKTALKRQISAGVGSLADVAAQAGVAALKKTLNGAPQPEVDKPNDRLEGTRGNVPSIAESVSSSGSQLQSDLEQERLRTAALERKLAQLERPSVVLTC